MGLEIDDRSGANLRRRIAMWVGDRSERRCVVGRHRFLDGTSGGQLASEAVEFFANVSEELSHFVNRIAAEYVAEFSFGDRIWINL